jgi:hypothetical protein
VQLLLALLTLLALLELMLLQCLLLQPPAGRTRRRQQAV